MTITMMMITTMTTDGSRLPLQLFRECNSVYFTKVLDFEI